MKIPPYYGPKTVVTTPGKKPREVKNLLWLLRHASEVTNIDLSPRDDGATCGCVLIALLEDGKTYRTAFNSLKVCRQWIKRRSLAHAVVRDNAPTHDYRDEALEALAKSPLGCMTWMDSRGVIMSAIYWNGGRRIAPADSKVKGTGFAR